MAQQVTDLYNLLVALHGLGKDMPDALIYLSEIVQPTMPSELRVPTLGRMFEELPQLFQQVYCYFVPLFFFHCGDHAAFQRRILSVAISPPSCCSFPRPILFFMQRYLHAG